MFGDLLGRFHDCPILVVGDLMLDEFVWGQVSRISPEAPVPVVEVNRRSCTAGGAANTAANVAALGGKPVVAGILGDDAAGQQVLVILQGGGASTEAIVSDSARPTTTKTRIIAHSQQVVRIDHEPHEPMPGRLLESLLGRVMPLLEQVAGCVVSDYGKGVIESGFVRELIVAARQAGVPVVIDPKGVDYAKYRGASLVKPNQLEAGKVLNRELHSPEEVRSAGQELLELLGPDSSLLITQGPQGMSLFEAGQEVTQIPAHAREVYDVTGAGDTVASTLGLALASGGGMVDACRLASLAAAIVVGKVGTATCGHNELKAATQVARW